MYYKWLHMVLVFLCLTYFTIHNAFQVHPCCHRWQYSVLLYSQVTVHCVYAPHSLSQSSVDRHLGCFRVLVIVNFSSHSQPCPPSVFSITVQVTIYLSCLILRFRSHPIYKHIYIYIYFFFPPWDKNPCPDEGCILTRERQIISIVYIFFLPYCVRKCKVLWEKSSVGWGELGVLGHSRIGGAKWFLHHWWSRFWADWEMKE